MKKATIRIRSSTDETLRDAAHGFVRAWESGESDPVATFTFSSPAQLPFSRPSVGNLSNICQKSDHQAFADSLDHLVAM